MTPQGFQQFSQHPRPPLSHSVQFAGPGCWRPAATDHHRPAHRSAAGLTYKANKANKTGKTNKSNKDARIMPQKAPTP
jgi:hypothetical protein